MRRAPGLGPAAVLRAASRAMSLRSGLGPAVSAAALLLLLRLGVLVSRVVLPVVLSAPVFLPWATQDMYRSTEFLFNQIFPNRISILCFDFFLWTARIVAPRYSSWCKVILYAIFLYVFCYFPNVKIRVRGKQGSTLLIAFCPTSIAHAINSGAHQEYVKVTLRDQHVNPMPI